MREGGREHDLTFDPETSSWLKFTKPSAAGYVVSFDLGQHGLRTALPLEYLKRLAHQSHLWEVGGIPFRGTPSQVSTPLPSMVTEIAISPGTEVKASDKLVTIEAMQMLTTVSAPVDGIVKEIVVKKASRSIPMISS